MKPFSELLAESQHARDTLLPAAEVQRYSRQLILPEVTVSGQRKLNQAKVVVIGAGGLGSAILLYLASTGIGTIGVVDGDEVDVSNLHRQVIHNTSRQGMNKAESAKITMEAINPLINIITYPHWLNQTNSKDIIPQYDLLVDGTDNAATRYLINDLAVYYDKPLVYGSALRWEGHVSLYNYQGGPCYRCIFPEAPAEELQGSCSDVGVMGMVPGLIGQLQATEVVKVILGKPSLGGKLLICDALESTFRKVTLRGKSSTCAACGESRLNPHEFNYTLFLSPTIPGKSYEQRLEELPPANLITAEDYYQLHRNSDHFLLDVRDTIQFQISHLPNAVNIPHHSLEPYLEDLRAVAETRTIFVFCRRGRLAMNALQMLLEHGISNAKLIERGLLACSVVDADLSSY